MGATALLMDVKKFAVHDGPGIRTTLFLKGCSLKCIWCHNPEGISSQMEMAFYAHKCIHCGECVKVCKQGAHQIGPNGHVFNHTNCIACGACEEVCLGEAMKKFGQRITVGEAVDLVLEDRIFYTNSNGGVTVSGGEPLLQANFVNELFTILKAEGIHTAIDTCGFVPWASFEMILNVTDMFLFDIKQYSNETHRKLTGQGNELILENLKKLSDAGKCIEIRMPFVPGCNTDDDTIHQIGKLLGNLTIERMKVLPYHSMARSKYLALGKPDTMPDVASPTDEMIAHAVDILRSYGINVMSGRA